MSMLMYGFDEFIGGAQIAFSARQENLFIREWGKSHLEAWLPRHISVLLKNSLNSTILDFQNRAIRLNVSKDIFLFNSP